MRSFLVAGKLSGVILHVLNRHAALLNLKQAALLKIMLRVLVLIIFFLLLFIYLSRGIQFNRASLNGALTKHKKPRY